MRDVDGRRVARLGDPTDHHGSVKTAPDGLAVQGVPVATEGCLVSCPKCGGDFPILVSRDGRRHRGRLIAHEGDLTACGARLMPTLRSGA